jgi:hypothetical protein
MKCAKQLLAEEVLAEVTALPAESTALTCRYTKHRATSCVCANV